MFKVIDLSKGKTRFAQITTIKFILPISKHQITFVGFSKQSIKALQYVFEVHDFQKQQILTVGKIDFLGMKLLTDFTPYEKDGAYIALVSSLGTKQIKLYQFPHGIIQNLHQPIDYETFQMKSLKQYYKINYNQHQKTIIIVEGASHKEQQQIIIRVFNEERQINNYRIIKLQSPPPCIFIHFDQVGFLWEKQFVLYSGEKWESRQFVIENINDFTIAGFHKNLIVKFKDNNFLFQMQESTLKPISSSPIIDSISNGNYLYTITDEQEQKLVVYEIQRSTYKQVYSQILPQNGFKLVGCDNSQIIIEK